MRPIVKIAGLLISLPFILVAISFAVTNTESLTLGLWPLEAEVSAPSALVIFAVLLFGFFIGAIASFIGAGRLRQRVRNAEYRLRQMEMETARIKREQEAQAAHGEQGSTALTQQNTPPVLAAE